MFWNDLSGHLLFHFVIADFFIILHIACASCRVCTTPLAAVNNEMIYLYVNIRLMDCLSPCIMWLWLWYMQNYSGPKLPLVRWKLSLRDLHAPPPPSQRPKPQRRQERVLTRIWFCYVVPPDICPDPCIQNDLSESELIDNWTVEQCHTAVVIKSLMCCGSVQHF